jgi:hypothetical protein
LAAYTINIAESNFQHTQHPGVDEMTSAQESAEVVFLRPLAAGSRQVGRAPIPQPHT